MATITEFFQPTVQAAAELIEKVKKESVDPATLLEVTKAQFEQVLKISEPKSTYLIDIVGCLAGKMRHLKRVVVLSCKASEKLPHGAIQQGEIIFLPEYFSPLPSKIEKPTFQKRHPKKSRQDKQPFIQKKSVVSPVQPLVGQHPKGLHLRPLKKTSFVSPYGATVVIRSAKSESGAPKIIPKIEVSKEEPQIEVKEGEPQKVSS